MIILCITESLYTKCRTVYWFRFEKNIVHDEGFGDKPPPETAPMGVGYCVHWPTLPDLPSLTHLAFSMSLTLSLRTVEISRIFLLNEKQYFLMSQVFSFCGEKLEYTYVRLIDSVLYFIL